MNNHVSFPPPPSSFEFLGASLCRWIDLVPGGPTPKSFLFSTDETLFIVRDKLLVSYNVLVACGNVLVSKRWSQHNFDLKTRGNSLLARILRYRQSLKKLWSLTERSKWWQCLWRGNSETVYQQPISCKNAWVDFCNNAERSDNVNKFKN